MSGAATTKGAGFCASKNRAAYPAEDRQAGLTGAGEGIFVEYPGADTPDARKRVGALVFLGEFSAPFFVT